MFFRRASAGLATTRLILFCVGRDPTSGRRQKLQGDPMRRQWFFFVVCVLLILFFFCVSLSFSPSQTLRPYPDPPPRCGGPIHCCVQGFPLFFSRWLRASVHKNRARRLRHVHYSCHQRKVREKRRRKEETRAVWVSLEPTQTRTSGAGSNARRTRWIAARARARSRTM